MAGKQMRGNGKSDVYELLALKWEDMDLETRTLQVRRSLSITKDGPTFNPPKTAKGRRRVGLTAAAVEARGDAYEDQGLVFPGEKGQPLRPWSLTGGPYLRLLERAGLPKGTRFHTVDRLRTRPRWQLTRLRSVVEVSTLPATR